MRAVESWKPTKFVQRGGDWRISLDPAELARISRVSASLALESIKAGVAKHARGHLADFGCGKVPFYGLYSGAVDQVTCIDWPNSAHGSNHIDVEADLNEMIEVPSGSFDTILCSSVLEHIWNHGMIWAEMQRTLRPQGKLILAVPFVYGLHEVPHDYFRWTRYALEKGATEAGLEVVELEPYGGGIDVVVDLLVRSLGAISDQAAGLAGRVAARVLRRGISKKLAPDAFEALPLGYTIICQKNAALG